MKAVSEPISSLHGYVFFDVLITFDVESYPKAESPTPQKDMHHPSLYRATSSNSLAISSNLEALLDYDEQHRRQESGSSLPERPASTTPFDHNKFITKGLPPPPRGPRKPRSRSTILTHNENVLESAASIYGGQEQNGVEGQDQNSPRSIGESWKRWGPGATHNPFINPAPTRVPHGGPASLRSVSTKRSSEGTICDIDERPQSVLSSISSSSFIQASRQTSASTSLRPHSPPKPDMSSRVTETDRPPSSLSFASSSKSVTRSATPQHGDVTELRRPPVDLREEMLSPTPSEKPFGQLHRLLSKVGIFDGLHASERVSKHPHPQAVDGARKEGHLDIGLLRLRGRKRHKEKPLDGAETMAVEGGGR